MCGSKIFFSQRAHTISQGWFSHFIKASVFVNGKRLMKKKEDENERRWDNFFSSFKPLWQKCPFRKNWGYCKIKRQADPTAFSSTYFFPASSFLNYYCYFSDLKRWLFGNNRKKSIYAEIVFERTCCHAFYCTCCVDSRRSLHFVIIVLWLEHQFTTKTLMYYVERSMAPISLLIFILYLAK